MRKYEKQLLRKALGIRKNRDFLIERFRKEWEDAERTRDEIELRIKQSHDQEEKRQRRYETAKEAGTVVGVTILGLVAACGLLTVAAIAPKTVAAFGRITGRRRFFEKKRFQKKLHYYQRRQYVTVHKNSSDGSTEVKLIKRGEDWIAQQALRKLRLRPQQKWDGIWRIVFFDISERNRWMRDGVRSVLKGMGFYSLQKSTFVSPYPCCEEIELLESIYNTGYRLRLVETKVINHDRDIKKFFALET